MINIALLKQLEAWRRKQAEEEGVELFRILPNQTLHHIVISGAKTEEALLEIKGIKEKKFAKYGQSLLAILNGKHREAEVEVDLTQIKVRNIPHIVSQTEQPLSVSDYLDAMNRHLFDLRGKVQGEVSQFQVRNNAVYFTIKDKEGQAVLSCFMWLNAYHLSGVELEEGLEIVVHGMPQVYKPTGRMSLNATTVELIGEGALKKAYEKLKRKLEAEGIFSDGRKKLLPLYPKKIGLITSREGAVIHDFMNNLGKWNFDVAFVNSRVEGVYALRDLREALRYFNKKTQEEHIDVIIIIRGGGSLESFQAFNNETIVREIADMPIPVIAGLGHHEDVPLAALAADIMVSTPTAATHLLNSSWQAAQHTLHTYQQNLVAKLNTDLGITESTVNNASRKITTIFEKYLEYFRNLEQKVQVAYVSIASAIRENKQRLTFVFDEIRKSYEYSVHSTKNTLRFSSLKISTDFLSLKEKNDIHIEYLEKNLALSDPQRQLRLGFSILHLKGKVIKDIEHIKKGDEIEMMLSNGKAKAKITDVI